MVHGPSCLRSIAVLRRSSCIPNFGKSFIQVKNHFFGWKWLIFAEHLRKKGKSIIFVRLVWIRVFVVGPNFSQRSSSFNFMIVSFCHFIQIVGVWNFVWTYWDTKLIQIISYGPYNIILCSPYNMVYILCIKVAYNDDLFPEMFNKPAVSLNFLNSCLIWYWCSHCFKACFWYILNTILSSRSQWAVKQQKVWCLLTLLRRVSYNVVIFVSAKKSGIPLFAWSHFAGLKHSNEGWFSMSQNSPKVKKSKEIAHMLIDAIGRNTTKKYCTHACDFWCEHLWR